MSDRRRVPGGGTPASGSAGPPVLHGLAWGLLAVGSLMVGLLLTGCGAEEPTEVPTSSVDGGPELSVLPPCAQIGEGFTVIATDLEPGEEYLVMIDPPHSDDLDDGALGAADQDGKLEIPASLPD